MAVRAGRERCGCVDGSSKRHTHGLPLRARQMAMTAEDVADVGEEHPREGPKAVWEDERSQREHVPRHYGVHCFGLGACLSPNDAGSMSLGLER